MCCKAMPYCDQEKVIVSHQVALREEDGSQPFSHRFQPQDTLWLQGTRSICVQEQTLRSLQELLS